MKEICSCEKHRLLTALNHLNPVPDKIDEHKCRGKHIISIDQIPPLQHLVLDHSAVGDPRIVKLIEMSDLN